MRVKATSRGITGLIVVAILLIAGYGRVANAYSATPSASTTQTQAAMGPFFRDLTRLETGKITQLNILQLGDSHTAADFFSGRLRLLLQQRFGNAGRGAMPPGIAFQGVDQRQMKFVQDDGWIVENSLKSSNTGPYGISGFVVKSQASGARMGLSANTPEDNFEEVGIDYLRHPGGGRFQVLLNGKPAASISTAGPEGQMGHYVFHSKTSLGEIEIIARAANIGITSWSVNRPNHGIILTSHGVVGASADIFNRWSPPLVVSDIAALKPSLILVVYGTNEGFDSDFKSGLYAQNFEHVLETLKKLAPNASILVVGPPDSQKADPACPTARTEPSECTWGAPPALNAVRDIQRDIAGKMGAGFWDWSSAMPEGMGAWVDRGLARSDHVHFTPQGYETAADQLFEWLMTGYASARTHVSKHGQRQ
ncbi:MAG: GDSL-type esterase/lipase family protein [Alphaproteobacteria bacterium]